MNKILVDTNILIYSIDEDSKYFESAQQILSSSENELYTSSKNLSEFLSVVTRTPGNTLSINEAITAIADFHAIFGILYPNRNSYEVFLNLLQTYHPAGLQIHDFEIAGIALANGIRRIATFNKKDFISIEEIKVSGINIKKDTFMKVKYFSDTDTAYVEFTEKDISETREISENIYIDLDAEGNLVSMTIEHAKNNAKLWEFSYQEVSSNPA